jgi:hypothetical protein
LGGSNFTTLITSVSNQSSLSNGIGLYAESPNSANGFGLEGIGNLVGVGGTAGPGAPGAISAGVFGAATSVNSFGVWGGQLAANGTGVFGQGAGVGAIGVAGTSGSGIGVLGQIPGSSAGNATGVYGLNYSTYAGSVPGAGGFGVYGLSANGHGLVGATAAPGAAALVGASNGVAGAYAGTFYGSVVVSGAFTVVGGAKSAGVPHPDGSHRRLYCMESPESWFEDFGKGQLECGQAEVTIDPDFAAVVDLTDYQVFLTQYGGYDVLSVTEQTPQGFRVETQDTASASRFGWRIVAKRKDIAAPRFETVTVPAEPILPPVPEIVTPEPPRIPDVRERIRQEHR